MPGKKQRLSTPVDPGSPPSKALKLFIQAAGFLVEAAGTAPASAMPIPRTVYCHSQQADRAYIGVFRGKLKASIQIYFESKNNCDIQLYRFYLFFVGRERIMQTNSRLQFHHPKLILIGLLGLLFLAGCSSVRGYQAPLDFDLDDLIKEPICTQANIDVDCRNKYIDYYIIQSSVNFSEFVRELTSERNTTNLILDNLRTGVDAAITVIGGAGTKAALGAAATGLGGLHGNIDKRLFYKKTVPALVQFMDAKRSLILAEILKGRAQDINTYPLSLAIRDLQGFNDAGSISAAINAVAAEGKQQAEKAEESLSILRDPKFVEVRAQVEVNNLLDLANSLPSGKAWEILQNPPSELDEFTNAQVEGELGDTQLSAAEGLLGGADNDADAKIILKLILSILNDRSKENLAKWVAAVNSEQ